MPAFSYLAIDQKGKNKKGVVEADGPKQARALLREKGLTPLEVEMSAAAEKKKAAGIFSFKRGISTADMALLTRQLSTLIAASLPLEESLKAVAEQSELPRIQNMILAVRSRVVEGHTLAESFAEFPHAFDDLYCSMVASGEKSGHLDKVLNRLADYTEQRQKMTSQLTQAMIYPVMLTLVAIGVVSLLLTSVVPKVVGQFEHMGQELPQITQILIGLSDFVSNYGLYLVVGIVLTIIVIKRLLLKPANRLIFDERLLKVPVIGKVSRGINTARFARTLSILNASAVPLLESMLIAGRVLTNMHARKLVEAATMRVREGTSLRAALTETKLFPPMMLHMIASGEQSGELGPMLERAADNQDSQFEAQVTMALGIFQPLLVVSMSGVVLFIVMAILQPILSLNNMVSG
ncbi:type II secretion system inner membrane protein GspF [Moritella sp. 36]|uniref:type II secretion system inner membrane protein GspF n=1 Tax=unclassified Moritella TaxID=2637987 RepID=UPI001BA62E79|nr:MULTISPECIES: type II secretion system inner membrane protein GspF [unclassified Moritella]QUM82512.1 type II secretion system inner membrane protein GspF [Moritella sp. 5]QUM91042.1 type II secretion system inner membrane protein GspF [Moritella sp. 36]